MSKTQYSIIGGWMMAGVTVQVICWWMAGTWILFTALAIVLAMANTARAEPMEKNAAELPYVTINKPQFTAASQAAFLHPNDLLIGITDGKTAKAYPAAILAQHGVVQDRMADGPIAVTW